MTLRMTKETSIILEDRIGLTADFTAEATKLRDSALAQSALIGKVTSPSSQDEAVQAQKALTQLRQTVEHARKAVKEPITKFGREIDRKAEEFASEIFTEEMRLARLLGDYQAMLQQNAWAAERLAKNNQTKLEQERDKALAQANTIEEADQIRDDYQDRIAAEAAPPANIPRADGQRVEWQWAIEVVDIHALYRNHSHCVKLAPLLSEIKSLLNAGATVQGVKATKIAKSTVRPSAQPKTIDV